MPPSTRPPLAAQTPLRRRRSVARPESPRALWLTAREEVGGRVTPWTLQPADSLPGFYRPSFVLEIDGDETSVGRSWRATFYIELVEFVTRERN